MPVAYKNSNGVTNDTTAVDVVAAPASGKTRSIPIGGISVKNMHNAAIDVILRLDDNSTTREIEQNSSLAVDDTFTNTTVINLETTTQKVQVVLGGAVATEADWVASYLEVS